MGNFARVYGLCLCALAGSVVLDRREAQRVRNLAAVTAAVDQGARNSFLLTDCQSRSLSDFGQCFYWHRMKSLTRVRNFCGDLGGGGGGHRWVAF
jgi:hypothetical protein